MAVTLTIDGDTKRFLTGSLDIVETLNGRSSLVVKALDLEGTYNPNLNDPITVDVDAANVFTGVVTGIQKTFPTFGAGRFLEIEAADHSSFAERLVVKGSTPGGVVARDIADYLVNNFLNPAFGVTRDAGMDTGGTIGATEVDYTKISDIFDLLLRLAAPDGWCWKIDEDKVLTAFLPSIGANPCPFTVEDGTNLVGDVKIRQVLENYANKLYYSYKIADDTIRTVTAEDSGMIALHGLYEAAMSTQGVLDGATAQSIADALIVGLAHVPIEVTFTTMTPGARTGQTITFDLVNRVADDALIHEVRTYTVDGKHVFYDIKALTGAIKKPTYLETYKLWAGVGGTAAPGGSSGIVTPPTPGTVIFEEDFEGGVGHTILNYAGAGGGIGVDDTNTSGLNGTTWGLEATPIPGDGEFPESGFDLGAPGFGTERSGWADFYCDFGNLEDGGWSLVVATVANYSGLGYQFFDLYVGTDSGSRYFWLYTGPGGTYQSPANVFAASTEQLVRIEWTQSSYSGGSANADGSFRVFIDGVSVWNNTGITIARAAARGDTDSIEIERMYFNPAGVLDEIRVGYGTYVPR